MTDKEKQQNQLSYMLADKLHSTTEKFAREHRAIDLNGVIGAANVYLSTKYMLAPDKATALQEIEKDFDIIRGMLNAAPDVLFGTKNAFHLN